MPISLKCTCGKALRVKDELAGKKIRCPACKGALVVPDPEIPEVEVELEEEAVEHQVTEKPKPKTSTSKHRLSYDEDDDDEDRPRRRRDRDDDDSEPERSSRKSKKKKHALQKVRWSDYEEKPRRERTPWIVISPAIISGVLMMIGAVVWFVLGLAFGRIFIWPPILFVLGIIAVVKGFMGYED